MTHDELSLLLDAKLDPLKADIADIKSRVYGNGKEGYSSRLSVLERECRQRGEACERRQREGRRWRFEVLLAFAGWIVTVIMFAVWR